MRFSVFPSVSKANNKFTLVLTLPAKSLWHYTTSIMGSGRWWQVQLPTDVFLKNEIKVSMRYNFLYVYIFPSRKKIKREKEKVINIS